MNSKTKYWLNLCDDDLLTAGVLLNSKRYLHMAFFCHMIVEKALKAVITEKTNDIPPKIHDLQKLAVYGGIFDGLSEDQLALIDKLAPFQIEARYPTYKEKIAAALTKGYCMDILSKTEEFLCWIKSQLEK